MTGTAPARSDAAAFRAVLTPYRSLGPGGFLVLMGFVALVSVGSAALFYAMGAWPVSAFFGLDVALLYGAFKLNYRAGRLYETVELTPVLLKITRVHPSGARENFDFNPYWVRVRLSEDADGRTRLGLASHGRELSLGRFLSDDERRDFAGALKSALRAAREPS